MSDLMQDVAGNLQQRIGQLVSQYETDMAVLRANAASQLATKDEELAGLRAELEAEKAKVAELEGKNVQAEEPADDSAGTDKSAA
jgi:hypothetical protein